MANTVSGIAPRSALKHRAAVQFAAAKPQESGSDAPSRRAVSLLARTGDSIEHWWWGKIIHDMAGFTAKRDKIAIDYIHDDREILGFCDKQTANNDGLTLGGELVLFSPQDRASEVAHKSDAGVPYQASIDWSGEASLEWVPEGLTAEANGKQWAGPCVIVRQWSIEGVAICPHGADSETDTELLSAEMSQEDGKLPTSVRSVTLFSQGNIPTKFAMNPNQPASPPAGPAQPATSHTDFRAELKRFTDRFGAEAGLKHFNAGTAFESALEAEFTAQQEAHKADVATLTAENDELKKKLAAVNLGEGKPVSFSEQGSGSTENKNQPQGMAKFIRFAPKAK